MESWHPGHLHALQWVFSAYNAGYMYIHGYGTSLCSTGTMVVIASVAMETNIKDDTV
jgi:hypothetical protein